MHLIGSVKRRLRLGEESGFAMGTVVVGVAVATILAVATVAATNSNVQLTGRSLDEKRAYEAAQAGIADYSFHLNNDNGYWARCTNVPTPNAVNQQGSTANKRLVPGGSGAMYALELIPATGKSSCNTSDPVGSMIEGSGVATGTFRIRSTGYSGPGCDTDPDGGACVRRSIVASYKRASFLDYVYFTQLETSDPQTYGSASTINGAYQQCSKTIQQGRYDDPIPWSGGQYCDQIVFATGERIDGPLHTNDALVICGRPTFGRSPSDLIEVSATDPGWYSSGCSGTSPTFTGQFVTSAPTLTPPPTNAQLKNVPGAMKFSGQVEITLASSSMTVKSGSTTLYTGSYPASGVIYVSNSSCSAGLNPFTATYPPTSTCGNVIVNGTYSVPLTIAAENDIIINGNVTRSGNGLLGLIANNFIRVKHPICPSSNLNCTSGGVPGAMTSQTGKVSRHSGSWDDDECNGVNGNGSLSNLRIDAAMLAIQHSFIVDHYDCGNRLGTLQVNGAISQKYRGPVGIVGEHGYSKDYNYDDRLRYLAPPKFLDPVESAWHMQRQTAD